ncbi:MAG TPA: hypothetical protein DCK95_01010 [Anaerolineaceae bacterium]|uniref:Putative membrane protein n=1 Tax=Anaerolinea thermophila TaxID=167964 RepID=A0A101FYQ3_9CHLR|nr:MAG: putative membrane protein [Anaerolinea thermophila]HAF60888.1 hypothetical protein [Anaerolineaceae bacterium]
MTIAGHKNNDRLKISQFVLSLIAFLLTLIATVGFFAGGSVLKPYLNSDNQTSSFFISMGSVNALLSVIHGYSLWYALKKPKEPRQSAFKKIPSFTWASIALLCLAVFCLLQLLAGVQRFFSPLYAFLTPLAIAIPLWWFVEFGKRKLPAISARKISGALSVGSSYTMLFILFLEIVFIAFILAAALLYLSSQPPVQQVMKSFSFPADLAQIDLPFLERYLRVILQEPLLVLGIFLVIGFILPFIEESMKPITLWALRNRSLLASDGFVLGLYFGAAFALVESTLAISQLGSEIWVESIALRAATSLIHITCSGLVGFGYATSMQSQKREESPRPFLTAVFLHGLWNSLALLSSSRLITTTLNITLALPEIYDILFPAALVIEWIATLLLLSRMNKELQQNIHPPEHNEFNDLSVHTNDVE